MSILIETDDRGRAVIPGHRNERFLVRDNGDGSLLFEPAEIITQAQREYDNDPELQALLARSEQGPDVHRTRRRRTS